MRLGIDWKSSRVLSTTRLGFWMEEQGVRDIRDIRDIRDSALQEVLQAGGRQSRADVVRLISRCKSKQSVPVGSKGVQCSNKLKSSLRLSSAGHHQCIT